MIVKTRIQNKNDIDDEYSITKAKLHSIALLVFVFPRFVLHFSFIVLLMLLYII